MKLFSNRRRPFHLGPYPLERLSRVDTDLIRHSPEAPARADGIDNVLGKPALASRTKAGMVHDPRHGGVSGDQGDMIVKGPIYQSQSCPREPVKRTALV